MPDNRKAPAPLQVARRDSFDHVVIETTGLANPAPIIETFVAFPVGPTSCPAMSSHLNDADSSVHP